MKSSPESHLEQHQEVPRNKTSSMAQPAGSESKHGLNPATASQAESLVAAEKRTLEMMANGAS